MMRYKEFFFIFLGVLSSTSSQAWYGPSCFSSKAKQVTLTLPSITGEAPGDLRVDFDDQAGKVKLEAVRPSKLIKNAHEIILTRDEESESGIFAVIVAAKTSSYGFKFELEFRKDASECTGAIIKVSDKPFSVADTGEAPQARKKAKTVKHTKLPETIPTEVPQSIQSETINQTEPKERAEVDVKETDKENVESSIESIKESPEVIKEDINNERVPVTIITPEPASTVREELIKDESSESNSEMSIRARAN